MIRHRLLAVATALAILGAACGDSGSSADEPLPGLAEILSETANAMLDVSSVGYEMQPTGGPVVFDIGLSLEFIDGRGVYAAPDSAESMLTLKLGGATFEVESIAIGDTVWVTEPLTGSWNQLGSGYNPAILFDPDEGIVQLLTEDLTGGAVAGRVSHSGREHFEVTGTVTGERVETITFGLAEGEAIPIVLLIDAETSLISNASFSTVTDGRTTDWSLDFVDYGVPVTIAPPNG